MNRLDFQALAQVRIDEAATLLAAQHWDGAYYLAGYAVECALKACIAKLTAEHDFPDKKKAAKCFVHDIKQLVEEANLKSQRKGDTDANAILFANWGTVDSWTEESRYLRIAEVDARKLVEAICDTPDGVFQWIKARW